MATAEAVRALEAATPWLRADFREGMDALRSGTALAARQFAEDMRRLAQLTAMVPRCPMDERGATPWTSFRREVASARSLSDRAAAAEIRTAVALAGPLPRMMELLEAGAITVQRARRFVTDLEPYDDDIAGLIDEQLAEQAAGLSLRRISSEVRRAAARLDPEAAARRTAEKNAARGVELLPDVDDQASVILYGPAVPLVRWHGTVDAQARALKQAGDPRTLDQLRFDLATSTFPCVAHAPADPTAPEHADADAPETDAPETDVPEADVPEAGVPDEPAATAPAGPRPSFVEPAATDCRRARPVQVNVLVPVETSLGLSNEPAWLDGYGWISAPTTRLLLVDAELRQVCVQAGTGQLVDVGGRDVRPPPTPEGLRSALLDMVLHDIPISDIGWRVEPQHDPSDALRRFVELRDRACDGPTGSPVSASRADLDHEVAYPAGPTAAWNLAARGQRTHQLKHYGWTPLRTPTSTLWTSPAGQIIEVPRLGDPPPGLDPDAHGHPPELPDAHELAEVDRYQLRPPGTDDLPPWVPQDEQPEPVEWTWLTANSPPPV
jgi:hypothetical protein